MGAVQRSFQLLATNDIHMRPLSWPGWVPPGVVSRLEASVWSTAHEKERRVLTCGGWFWTNPGFHIIFDVIVRTALFVLGQFNTGELRSPERLCSQHTHPRRMYVTPLFIFENQRSSLSKCAIKKHLTHYAPILCYVYVIRIAQTNMGSITR